MSDPITIGKVMTAHPYFVDIDSHLNGAKVMLTQYNLHHMPVKKDDDIVGIISLRDIERAEMHGVDTSIGTDVRVREVCQPAISSIVEPGTPLKTVLQKMADEHLECVVIATDSHLEGIFTVTDACKRYAQSLE